jgi:hypothetical protein
MTLVGTIFNWDGIALAIGRQIPLDVVIFVEVKASKFLTPQQRFDRSANSLGSFFGKSHAK